MRRRSRAGSCITSPFNLRSAASPDTGLLPVVVVGLSLALTHGARPISGISRVTLPYIAAISWLCRCSFSPVGDDNIGSIRLEYSDWLSRPVWLNDEHIVGFIIIVKHEYCRDYNTFVGSKKYRRKKAWKNLIRTSQKLSCGFFIYEPLLRADGGFQGCVQRFKVNSRRYYLTSLDSLRGAGCRDCERLCR